MKEKGKKSYTPVIDTCGLYTVLSNYYCTRGGGQCCMYEQRKQTNESDLRAEIRAKSNKWEISENEYIYNIIININVSMHTYACMHLQETVFIVSFSIY